MPPASSPRTTQPRVSAVSSNDRPLSRGNNKLEKLAAEVDDPTTTMDPTDQTARQKFVNPEDLRTAIAPRGRAGTPLSTAVTAPQKNNTTYAQTQSGSSQSPAPSSAQSGGASQPYGQSPSYLQPPSSVQAQTGAQQAAAQRAAARARVDTPLTPLGSDAQARAGGRARVDTPVVSDMPAQAAARAAQSRAGAQSSSETQSRASQFDAAAEAQSQLDSQWGGQRSGAQSQSSQQSQSAQSQSQSAQSQLQQAQSVQSQLAQSQSVQSQSQPAGSSQRSTPARGIAVEPRTSMVSALAAAAGSSIAITEKSMPIAPAPQPSLLETAPRTQVWVATHKVPDDPDQRLILLREPDSARAASFRVLRHRLQERGDPRVVAVTSARAHEGKTTCAVNLALALGECGRARVLLVEANLRSPALAPLFGFMPPECFSTQLARHKEKPEDAWSVVEVYSPSLHVLAVKPDGEARPLLDGPAFRIAIEMLAQAGYDYIVIDTPPVLGAADVNLIEDSADGVLFVALSGTTPATALRQAVEQLQPAKLLGITLLDA